MSRTRDVFAQEFLFNESIANIKSLEREIKTLKIDVLVAKECGNRLKAMHDSFKISDGFICGTFNECERQLQDVDHPMHHNYALFMACKTRDFNAVSWALKTGKKIEISHDRVKHLNENSSYEPNWFPFKSRQQSSAHVGCGSKPIMALLIDSGWSILRPDRMGKLPSDLALEEQLTGQYKWLKIQEVTQKEERDERRFQHRLSLVDKILQQYSANLFRADEFTLNRLLSYAIDLMSYNRVVYRNISFRLEGEIIVKNRMSLTRLRKLLGQKLKSRF